MLLKDIGTPEVVYCTPDTSVLAAARLMRTRHVGDVVIVDDEEDQTPLGIVTDRDIVVEVLGQEQDPARVTVREIMRAPVVIGAGSEDTTTALARMRHHGVRRMPVMGDDRRLIGMVTLDDLLKRLAADAAALTDIVAHEQEREHHARR